MIYLLLVRNYNKHHICFPQSDWNCLDPTKYLREQEGLKVPLLIEAHHELHKNVSIIPMMGEIAMERVVMEYIPDETYIGCYTNLIQAFENAIKYNDIKPADRKIGALAIEMLSHQEPYLKDGLITNKIRHNRRDLKRQGIILAKTKITDF